MTLTTSAERLGEGLARSLERWESRLKADVHTATAGGSGGSAPPPAFCVAISREAGTDAGAVAAHLSERLGWPVCDRELLGKIAETSGLRASLLDRVDEKRTDWVSSLFAGFASSHAGPEEVYLHHLPRVLLALAAGGKCILVGRGAPQLLPPERTLRVRLVAPLPDRIRSYQRRHGVSSDEAARQVDDTDRKRSRFVQETFFKDPADPRGYDLILNTSRFGPEGCADLIERALLRATPASS